MKICSAVLLVLFIFAGNISKIKAGKNDSLQLSMPEGAYQLGAYFYGGFVMTPYERVANIGAHTNGMEIILAEKTCGKQAWQCVYNMPRVGISLFYLDFGKPDITGKVIAVLPHMQFPLVRSKKSEIGFRLATGIGYFTKVFDTKTNFKNKAISSHFNACMQPAFLYSYKINKHLEANAGFGLTHFSNGSFSLPNNGINVPNIFAGMMYSFSSGKQEGDLVLKRQPIQKKQYFYTYLGIGSKQAGKFIEKSFPAYTLSSCYGWQPSHRSKIGVGIDANYDPSHPVLNNAMETGTQPLDSVFRAGLKLEHELVIGKLGIVANMGYYFFDNYKKDGPIFQHVGLKYNFLKNAFAGVFLKTHFASADFIEFALGFNL